MAAVVDAGNNKASWADDADEEYDGEMSQEITEGQTREADGSIRKTVVEYKKNERGQNVKITKVIRMQKVNTRVNKRVEERKKWKKFGEARDARGPEPGITSVERDEVYIDMTSEDGQAGEAKGKKEPAINLGIVCRNCGKTGDHWTHKCPYFKGDRSNMPPPETDLPTGRAPSATGEKSSSSVYVPPSRRGGAAPGGPREREGGDDRSRAPRDDVATVRVTNLSEDTKESDLTELFRSFGPIQRTYLAKDQQTGLSKGFAYVNFVYREDAARAIEKLSGKFGYDHLILHLEWAKPSNK